MKTFEELTEKEINELTEEQIAGFIAMAFMEEGVAKLPKPEPFPTLSVPPIEKMQVVRFKGYNEYNKWNVAFKPEICNEPAIKDLLVRYAIGELEKIYPSVDNCEEKLICKDRKSVGPAIELLFVALNADSAQEVVRHNEEVNKKYSEMLKEWQEKNTAANEVENRIRGAVYSVKSLFLQYAEITAVYDDYRRMTKTDADAFEFLCKRFQRGTCEAAFKELGIENPCEGNVVGPV